ncbi:NADP-dependent oxidoreductase [Pseudonocardia adelaidensis]|uniref:NADP-dependent oxidoreductase n=1 Tax=Pseudonocardia adelaidensis TaxID=648754 RepID=A0ABP9NQ41_9PSEU
MARVVKATAFGGPEVLAVVDEPVPAPGPGEVTIRVEAAAVNPIDYKIYSGLLGRDPDTLPQRVGMELAGVVTAAGPGAHGPAGPLAVGDEVIAYRRDRPGAYATEVTWEAEFVVPKPARLSFAEASGLLLTGSTAVHALTATGVRAGDTLLLHGAAGSVGRHVAQLARDAGAEVIGTASPRRHDELSALGVRPVAYGPGLADRVRALAPAGVDAAIDAVGTDEAVDVSLELVADRERIATLAAFARGAEAGIQMLGTAPGATDRGDRVRRQAWPRLLELATAGRLRTAVTRTFPLAEAARAHAFVAEGHAGGKVVLLGG